MPHLYIEKLVDIGGVGLGSRSWRILWMLVTWLAVARAVSRAYCSGIITSLASYASGWNLRRGRLVLVGIHEVHQHHPALVLPVLQENALSPATAWLTSSSVEEVGKGDSP